MLALCYQRPLLHFYFVSRHAYVATQKQIYAEKGGHELCHNCIPAAAEFRDGSRDRLESVFLTGAESKSEPVKLILYLHVFVA